MSHHIDEDRDIECVESNDGQLVILKGDDRGEHASDKTEFPLKHPYSCDAKTDERGSDRHICLFVDDGELFGGGALLSGSERVKTS